MTLEIIKEMWEYTTYNKLFLVLITVLFFLFCMFMEAFDEMKIPFALYLSMIPYIFISGYGMAITKDVLNGGKRLPKILIKDVVVLGIKTTFVAFVYLFVQGLLFAIISVIFHFPIIDFGH